MTRAGWVIASRNELVLRSYRPCDYPQVVGLMASTMLLGAPMIGNGITHYVEACLAPYLENPEPDAAVVVDGDGTVIAYALVCVDPKAGERAARRATCRLALTVGGIWLRGRLDRESARFYWARVRDLGGLLRGTGLRSTSPHAHLNVASGLRSGSAALMLRDHIDATVRSSGHSQWCGEVNAIEGRRDTALTRLGFEVVGRTPNHTLSRFIGRRVERLALRRQLDQ